MRDSHGQIFAKIGDFGLSRILSTNTIYAQSRVGTPYYMSPEQVITFTSLLKQEKHNLGQEGL